MLSANPSFLTLRSPATPFVRPGLESRNTPGCCPTEGKGGERNAYRLGRDAESVVVIYASEDLQRREINYRLLILFGL
ncbi:hypothetical protein CEXT_495541 [Caerostris extrusa]|uniref:Uncharacterized protein n=1 Tax=Caerostris extrusa TaxID=172846 RepID=A0AAV4PZE3_CAEEX|nr:hypothetical protein CEXT_495541 [Caerostris extrusa]